MWDDIVDRALGRAGNGDLQDDHGHDEIDGSVEAYVTVAGWLQLTDGDAYLASDTVTDLERVR